MDIDACLTQLNDVDTSSCSPTAGEIECTASPHPYNPLAATVTHISMLPWQPLAIFKSHVIGIVYVPRQGFSIKLRKHLCALFN